MAVEPLDSSRPGSSRMSLGAVREEMEMPEWLYPASLVCQPSGWKYQTTTAVHHGAVNGVRFDGLWLTATQQYYNILTAFAFNAQMLRYDRHVREVVDCAVQEIRQELLALKSRVVELDSVVSRGPREESPEVAAVRAALPEKPSAQDVRVALAREASGDASLRARLEALEPRLAELETCTPGSRLRALEAAIAAAQTSLVALNDAADASLVEHGQRLVTLETEVEQRLPEKLEALARFAAHADVELRRVQAIEQYLEGRDDKTDFDDTSARRTSSGNLDRGESYFNRACLGVKRSPTCLP